MLIPANHKGETAIDNGVFGIIVGAFQRARREQGVVGWVERDGAKLFPVPYQGVLGQNFMEGQFGLRLVSAQSSRQVSSAALRR